MRPRSSLLKRGVQVSVLALALAALAVTWAFRRDMERAYARVQGQSVVLSSPWGDIEYATGGAGTPVLVVHGSGGGFDQGALVARTVLDERYRWIAPSRFGYLRSTFRAGATFDEQAHAYAHLLDHLGIERVAVVALSHGGPSALLFAVLHPQRVQSLVLLSAGVASSGDAQQQQANRQGDALVAIYDQDIRYWAMTHAFRGTFLRLMGAGEDIVAGLDPARRQLVDEVIDGMNPVSPRAAGVRFDNRAAMPDRRIAAIRAPTLIVHARDDTLQVFRNAEFAAARIPGARLLAFGRGGHLVIAVEQPAVRQAVGEFIAAHADATGERGGPAAAASVPLSGR